LLAELLVAGISEGAAVIGFVTADVVLAYIGASAGA
jgi:hypothetical protein